MGISVSGHINPEFSVSDIIDFLKARHGVRIVDTKTNNFNHHILGFNVPNDDYVRIMHVHERLGIFGSNLVTMDVSASAYEIIDSLAEQFSGLVFDNPTDEKKATAYVDRNTDGAGYNHNNALYVIKWGLAHNHIQNSRVEDLKVADECFDIVVRKREK